MGSKRPPALQKKMYVEIDPVVLAETGEIKILGEPIVVPEITVRVPRGQFEVVYTSELFDVMRQMGNRKIELFAYLLDKKDGNNCVNTSIRSLSKETGMSYLTVQKTLKILKDADLISQKGSVYMISPRLMLKGNQVREAYLMRKYVEMTDEKEIIESEIDNQYKITENGDIVQEVR